jgi:hypothetical protein
MGFLYIWWERYSTFTPVNLPIPNNNPVPMQTSYVEATLLQLIKSWNAMKQYS